MHKQSLGLRAGRGVEGRRVADLGKKAVRTVEMSGKLGVGGCAGQRTALSFNSGHLSTASCVSSLSQEHDEQQQGGDGKTRKPRSAEGGPHRLPGSGPERRQLRTKSLPGLMQIR